MAIVKMSEINIVALKKNRKKILEKLQRFGITDINNLKLDDEVFSKEDTAHMRNVFIKSSENGEKAYEILNSYIPEDKSIFSSFEGRKNLSIDDYEKFVENRDEIMRIASEIINCEKQISDSKIEIAKLENQIQSLRPWEKLDISMRFKGTNTVSAFIGTFPTAYNYTSCLNALNSKSQIIFDIEIISSSSDQTCVFILCPKKDTLEAEQVLRALGFSFPSNPSKQPPAERINILLDRIKSHQDSIDNNIKYIKSNVGMRHAFNFIEDYYSMRADKYEVINKLANTRNAFVLNGFIPSDQAEAIKENLIDTCDAYVEISEPSENQTVPTLLKNNSFISPVEPVLSAYSLPNQKEIDPSTIMAIFYYILFGIMFSDAGYGLIMALACGFILLKFKNMEENLKKSIKMFFFSGISTIFWGLMFGSFFGDAIPVIADFFFNKKVTFDALWFNAGNETMRMLMFSLTIGVIHIFTGLVMLGVKNLKNGDYLAIIYDSLSWVLLVGGAILALLTSDIMAGMANIKLDPIYTKIGGICCAIGALIIILFNGRESKNPVKRFFKGLYGLYNVTGYLSDILSYSRLLALGLATGTIGQVFNQIACLVGNSFFGKIVFILVFVIGHSLNIGINALGAYVHTNRLQYIEFFGRFYEGEGKPFNPFKIKTKHYNIKEDIING